jgi:hypothetical protein
MAGSELRLILETSDKTLSESGINVTMIDEKFPIKEKYWIDHANICTVCNKFIPCVNEEYKHKPNPKLINGRCSECIVHKCSDKKCNNDCMFYEKKCSMHTVIA